MRVAKENCWALTDYVALAYTVIKKNVEKTQPWGGMRRIFHHCFSSSLPINRRARTRHKSVVVMSLTFKHPFTGMVVGPTSCGKTRFVFRLIDNAVSMLQPPPSKIMYCYGEYQQLFCRYPQVIFHEGLPDMDNFDGREPILLIVDDLTLCKKQTRL